MSSTNNKPRSSPRIAALRSRVSVTVRSNVRPRPLLRSNTGLPSEVNTTRHTQPRPITAVRTSTAVSRSSNEAGTTSGAAAGPSGSRVRLSSRASTRNSTIATGAARAGAVRAQQTTPIASSCQCHLAPASSAPKQSLERVFQNLRSPFSDSSNSNDRRQSLSMATVIYCPICFMDIKRNNKRALVTACGHIFCDVCLHEAHRIRKICALCQQFIAAEDFREIFY